MNRRLPAEGKTPSSRRHISKPAPSGETNAAVPRLVNFSGTLSDLNGKPLTGVQGVTFQLYKDEQGSAPLWMETQNVAPDKNGRYSVQLGSTRSEGLPSDLFASGEARWLAVQVVGQAEQSRVMLLNVPCALKAADAQTVGGLPASAFMLANGTKGSGSASTGAASSSTSNVPPPANPAVTGKGTAGSIPVWDTTSDIVNSVMVQKSSAIGVGTTNPAATLDVNGKSDVRDMLTLFPKGTDSTLAVNRTAFKIDQAGKVSFVTGQTFPGVPLLKANNTFVGGNNFFGNQA